MTVLTRGRRGPIIELEKCVLPSTCLPPPFRANHHAAWEDFESGAEEPIVLTEDEAAAPSDAVVYQVMLESPLTVVKANVTQSGAYALFLEHGGDEIPVTLISASGEVLVTGA